jgi:hypothetical protein
LVESVSQEQGHRAPDAGARVADRPTSIAGMEASDNHRLVWGVDEPRGTGAGERPEAGGMTRFFDPLTERGCLIIPNWDLETPGKLDLASVSVDVNHSYHGSSSSWHSWDGHFELDRWLIDWNKRMWLIIDFGAPDDRQRFTGRIQLDDSSAEGRFEITKYAFYGMAAPTIEPITGEWLVVG